MKLKSSIIASRRQEDTSTESAPATQILLPDPAPKQQSSQRVPSLCEVSPSSPIDSRALNSLELKPSQDIILSVPSTPGVKAAEPAISQALPGNDTLGGGKGAGPGLGVHKGESPEDEGGQSQSGGSRSPCSAPDSVPSLTWCQSGEGPPARQLLRKLRWATLGPAYDWTRREYSSAASSPVLPAYLRELAIRLAAAASGALGEARVVSSSAGSGGNIGLDGLEGSWRPFQPNAALVNYYQSDSDTLCGHKVCLLHATLTIFILPCRHSTLHKQLRTPHVSAAQCSAPISCVTNFRMLDLRKQQSEPIVPHPQNTVHIGAICSIPTSWNV